MAPDVTLILGTEVSLLWTKSASDSPGLTGKEEKKTVKNI